MLTDVACAPEGVCGCRASAPGGQLLPGGRRGFVAAEMVKADGVERRIALSPGDYRVKRRLADRLRVGEVSIVGRRQVTVLDESKLRTRRSPTIR